MSRKRDVDWSDWDGQVKTPEHPLSKPLDSNLKKGVDVAREALTTGQLPHLGALPKPQPNNSEMFGHLVVTEDTIKAKEQEWENKIQDTLTEARKPIDHLNKSKVDGEWGCGVSFNSLLKGQLTKEELAERNMDVKSR